MTIKLCKQKKMTFVDVTISPDEVLENMLNIFIDEDKNETLFVFLLFSNTEIINVKIVSIKSQG